VAAGAVLGVVVGRHLGCVASCLHWGARRGATYIDPLSLLSVGPVRLLPLDHSVRPPVHGPVVSGVGDAGAVGRFRPSSRLVNLAPSATAMDAGHTDARSSGTSRRHTGDPDDVAASLLASSLAMSLWRRRQMRRRRRVEQTPF
jgi:hypothetical protein